MAPSHSRQLLVWTLPAIAAILSYLWYKRKRIGAQSDPGEKSTKTLSSPSSSIIQPPSSPPSSLDHEFVKSTSRPISSASPTSKSTPNKSFSRSLSGVESSPIDIVIPPKLRSVKSNPVPISDEDLDLEIEKVKSMKTNTMTSINNNNREANKEAEKKQDSPPNNNNNNKSPSLSPNNNNKTPSPKMTPFKHKIIKNDAKEAKVDNGERSVHLKATTDSFKSKDSKEQHKKKNDDHRIQRQSSERDSANHSPVDVMLASPSLSSISDNHSEGSSDSGKGGSDVATPPPSRTPGVDSNPEADLVTVYEFVMPQTMVGKLIGRHGSFVAQIKEKTGANILVGKHPTNSKLKLCSVEGTKQAIDKAMKVIRDKFPLKRFPDLTLEQINVQMPISLMPDHLYLKLVEGINNDTIVSCMVAPNYLFLQQPTHPTFPNLNILSNCMNVCYQDINSPLLPTPIPENTICVAHSVDSWYRAMVLSTDMDTDTSYVKFLDYGGFAYVENAKLRQIRGDFMLLPFQAAECMLANVRSLIEDGSWPDEAYNLVAEITKGAIIYTQVADYTEEGIPLVLCYVVVGPQQVVFLNQQLVEHGFAEWLPSEEDHHQQTLDNGSSGHLVEAATCSNTSTSAV